MMILIVVLRKVNVNFMQVCECLETTKTTALTSTTTASTTSATTASTSTTTASTTLSGCGSPQWSNDKWCDDDNNNAGCNFDGGACCNNFFSGWNTYCQVISY
jgi:hypothetical protein